MNKLLFLPLALLPMTAHAFEDVQEGLWELTAVMHVDGGQDYGPYTQKQCITKKDIQNPALLFAEGTGNCDFTNQRFFVNEFSFNVRCNAGIPLTGTGKVEYGSNWVKGNMDLTAQVPGGASVETSSEVSGKRVGDCSQ